MSFRPQKESVREAAAIGYPLASNTRPKVVFLSSQASIRAALSNNLPLAGDYDTLERPTPAKAVWSRPCLEAGQEVGATVGARVDCERNASLGDMLRMAIPLHRTTTTSGLASPRSLRRYTLLWSNMHDCIRFIFLIQRPSSYNARRVQQQLFMSMGKANLLLK